MYLVVLDFAYTLLVDTIYPPNFQPERVFLLLVMNGTKGEMGRKGPPGDDGDRGPKGIMGLKGEMGDNGTMGDQGPPGSPALAGHYNTPSFNVAPLLSQE